MNYKSLIDPFGRLYVNPTNTLIRDKLEELFDPQTEFCPHRDLSLTDYKSGLILTYHHNKILTLENANTKINITAKNQYISNVALVKAFALFTAFNNKKINFILNLPWNYQI